MEIGTAGLHLIQQQVATSCRRRERVAATREGKRSDGRPIRRRRKAALIQPAVHQIIQPDLRSHTASIRVCAPNICRGECLLRLGSTCDAAATAARRPSLLTMTVDTGLASCSNARRGTAGDCCRLRFPAGLTPTAGNTCCVRLLVISYTVSDPSAAASSSFGCLLRAPHVLGVAVRHRNRAGGKSAGSLWRLTEVGELSGVPVSSISRHRCTSENATNRPSADPHTEMMWPPPLAVSRMSRRGVVTGSAKFIGCAAGLKSALCKIREPPLALITPQEPPTLLRAMRSRLRDSTCRCAADIQHRAPSAPAGRRPPATHRHGLALPRTGTRRRRPRP